MGNRYGPGPHSTVVLELERQAVLSELEDEAYRLGKAGCDESLLQHLVSSATAYGIGEEFAKLSIFQHYSRGVAIAETERRLIELS